jgi:nicotinamidase-related amidase
MLKLYISKGDVPMPKLTTREKYKSFYYEKVELPEVVIDPKTTALLIVDMQNEFVLRDFGEALEFKEAGIWEDWIPFHDRLDDIVIPNNVKLLNYFREKGMAVTFGRIACYREDGEDRSPVQKSDGWNNMLMPINSYSAQMINELTPSANEIVVNKTTDSVTTGTNYLQLLRFMGIKHVVVTGIVTDQCVASTVRGLADDGYHVICVEDACAAGSMELHDAELKIMNVIYCDVLSTDETIDLIDSNL